MATPESKIPGITADTALATIALRSDAYAAILARHRLDFCCGGQRTLSQACAKSGLDVTSVLRDLERAQEERAAAAIPTAWSERSLLDVIDVVVDGHHAYTREALLRIPPLLAKVHNKHGQSHPELLRTGLAFSELAADLAPHMVREERVLFPYIRSLALLQSASSGELRASPSFRTVRNPVRMMMAEHDRAGELLAEIQDATGDFSPPSDACPSFRALYAALAELRLDLMRHVSLENNVLFPRAIELEERYQAPLAASPARSW